MSDFKRLFSSRLRGGFSGTGLSGDSLELSSTKGAG